MTAASMFVGMAKDTRERARACRRAKGSGLLPDADLEAAAREYFRTAFDWRASARRTK